MKTIFDLCKPRKDVRKGAVKESDFAADLAQVLRQEAPAEYGDPAVFFANTHPTEGLKALLRNVCQRLTGKGGEAASIFRLDTQYGGGKTHALIALTHAANGLRGVPNWAEFIDPALVPRESVRIGAFDGENADPANGRALEGQARAFTPWGELAYALAGMEGYERLRRSDVERTAPGADTLRDLFGGEPTLLLLDELSVYLRKVRGRQDAEQLTPFLTSLFKAVESSAGAVLVFTLAIGKEGRAVDAYSAENEWVAAHLEEAQKVAARKATVIDPTAEHEVAQVLRRRLFERIDDDGVAEVVEAYRGLWHAAADQLPKARLGEDRVAELRAGFPLHPALLSTLTDKLSTLSNFQRVRGMLRLLTQAVARLWADRPAGTHAIHVHHLDPSFAPTHNEIATRLELGAFDPAIRNDVASMNGGASLAEQLDGKDYAGLAPYGSHVARTILWHTFAFNEHLKGLSADELRYAVLAPGLDLGFVDDARRKFVAGSAYLDDRMGAPLRFLTEANLTMMIRRQEEQVDPGDARAQLQDRIRSIFGGPALNLVPFASGPYDVPNDAGDGRPFLVLLSYDAETVKAEGLRIPSLVEKIFRHHGTQQAFRQLQNHLVFLVADHALRDEMKAKMVRRLALEALRLPERLAELAEHQQDKIQELYQRSEQELALAIQQCHRHLFFPSRNLRMEGASVELGHVAFDVHSASEKPGVGQQQVLRALADNNKLLRAEDHPLAPSYIRDQTPLKQGQMTTAALRDEFRRDPRLPILLGDENFVKLVRKGISEEVYVYKSGELLAGPGDPWAEIKIDEQSIVYTMGYAKERELWPRKPPPEDKSPEDDSEDREGGRGTGTGDTIAPPLGSRVFKAEAPLREALTRIWEDARNADVGQLQRLSLRVFETQDAFRLLGAVNAVSSARRSVRMAAEYETTEGSSLSLEFEGGTSDAGPVREFLQAQFRAASDSDLSTTYSFEFEKGLDLASEEPEKMTDSLARFATGAAFVEAVAEAKA
jgi:hypothetical protein